VYNFIFTLKGKLTALKKEIQKDQRHFALCAGLLIVGFLIALMGDYGDFEASPFNPVYQAYLGANSYIKYGVYMALFTALLYLSVLGSGFSFVFYCIFGYGGILIFSYFSFRYAFIAVSVSAFHGLLYFVLYILPLVLINSFAVSFALKKLYHICGFSCNKKGFGRYDYKSIFNAIKYKVLFSIVFNLLWYSILSFIFSRIY
jgi:hypothetical protein